MLCKKKWYCNLKVPFTDLVAKGKHPEKYTGTTKDYGYRKEYAFGKTWRIGIETALPLVITHEDETQEIDTK